MLKLRITSLNIHNFLNLFHMTLIVGLERYTYRNEINQIDEIQITLDQTHLFLVIC